METDSKFRSIIIPPTTKLWNPLSFSLSSHWFSCLFSQQQASSATSATVTRLGINATISERQSPVLTNMKKRALRCSIIMSFMAEKLTQSSVRWSHSARVQVTPYVKLPSLITQSARFIVVRMTCVTLAQLRRSAGSCWLHALCCWWYLYRWRMISIHQYTRIGNLMEARFKYYCNSFELFKFS